eukprot:5735798-Prymnesium_polylepis.1
MADGGARGRCRAIRGPAVPLDVSRGAVELLGRELCSTRGGMPRTMLGARLARQPRRRRASSDQLSGRRGRGRRLPGCSARGRVGQRLSVT